MKNNTKTLIMAGSTLALGCEATGLRVNAEGDALEAVGMPTDISPLPLRPLCAVGGGFVIAALGRRLYSLHNGNVTMIGDIGAGGEVFCGIAGGDHAIVMTSGGPLHIVVEGEEAVCLGTLPDLPQVDVALEVCATLSETVPALALTDTESLRSGSLSARDAAALMSALEAVWQRIKVRAAGLGAVVVPESATITAEVRRLDQRGKPVGSRGRMAVGAGVSAEAVQVAVNGDILGPFTVSVPVVKARITVGNMSAEQLAVWGAGSVKAEVALSAAPAVAASWTVRIERPASGEPRATVITHLEAVPADIDAPLQSVAVIAGGNAESVLVSVPVKITSPVAEVVACDGFIAHAGAVSGDVVMWGCLEGAVGDVAVAPASSPLALMSRSTVSLSPVAALVAAPRRGSVALSPGCAHFYAFTADGTLNVSVGANRGAASASLLDRRAVSRREAVAVMTEGVVALTDGGNELIMLRGGGASTLYRSSDRFFKAVAAEPVHGELYLIDNEGSLHALDVDRLWLTGRYLPYTVESMAAAGRSLYLISEEGIADITAPDGETAVEVEWRGCLTPERPVAALYIRIGIDAPGGFKGSVSIWPTGFPTSRARTHSPMWKAHIDGAPRSPLVFRLPMPVRAGAEVEISGVAAPGTRLTDIAVTTETTHRYGR